MGKALFYIFVIVIACSACTNSKKQTSPNLILADDLGYADVGFNGCT